MCSPGEHLQVQIAEARYAIERETILLATRRATRESLKVIFDVIDAASPPPESFVENMKSNARFHLAVAAASQNAVLVDMLQPLLEIGFDLPKYLTAKAPSSPGKATG